MPNPVDEKRPDGTEKGSGWLGPIARPDGKISSEISVGVEIDGKEILIPTMVPTLTQGEIDYLLSIPTDEIFTRDQSIGASVRTKAVEHAMARMKQGKSPFYTDEDRLIENTAVPSGPAVGRK
jgi:hypothetical protein